MGVDYESNKIQFIGNSASEPLNLWQVFQLEN